MRSLKFALAAMAATMALGTAQAEPVKIRMAWVAPVSNWASIVLEKKDLAKHLGIDLCCMHLICSLRVPEARFLSLCLNLMRIDGKLRDLNLNTKDWVARRGRRYWIE